MASEVLLYKLYKLYIIQNLSPSALNTSILTYADPSDRHQIYSGYSGYTLPQSNLQVRNLHKRVILKTFHFLSKFLFQINLLGWSKAWSNRVIDTIE